VGAWEDETSRNSPYLAPCRYDGPIDDESSTNQRQDLVVVVVVVPRDGAIGPTTVDLSRQDALGPSDPENLPETTTTVFHVRDGTMERHIQKCCCGGNYVGVLVHVIGMAVLLLVVVASSS